MAEGHQLLNADVPFAGFQLNQKAFGDARFFRQLPLRETESPPLFSEPTADFYEKYAIHNVHNSAQNKHLQDAKDALSCIL